MAATSLISTGSGAAAGEIVAGAMRVKMRSVTGSLALCAGTKEPIGHENN